MRVMIIGATGAVGTPLVRQLLEAGHEVIGTSRSQDRAKHLGILGAHPIVLDALDAPAVRTSVAAAQPEAIIYQATGLAGVRILRSLDRPFAATNRLRTEGLDNVLDAAGQAGVRRIVAQSFAPYRYAREGGWVKTEDDPLDPAPPASARQTFAAMSHLERAVNEAGGSRSATAASTARATRASPAPCANVRRPSSATVTASCRSSISTMPPRPPCSHSTTTARPSTTSSTTSPPP